MFKNLLTDKFPLKTCALVISTLVLTACNDSYENSASEANNFNADPTPLVTPNTPQNAIVGVSSDNAVSAGTVAVYRVKADAGLDASSLDDLNGWELFDSMSIDENGFFQFSQTVSGEEKYIYLLVADLVQNAVINCEHPQGCLDSGELSAQWGEKYHLGDKLRLRALTDDLSKASYLSPLSELGVKHLAQHGEADWQASSAGKYVSQLFNLDFDHQYVKPVMPADWKGDVSKLDDNDVQAVVLGALIASYSLYDYFDGQNPSAAADIRMFIDSLVDPVKAMAEGDDTASPLRLSAMEASHILQRLLQQTDSDNLKELLTAARQHLGSMWSADLWDDLPEPRYFADEAAALQDFVQAVAGISQLVDIESGQFNQDLQDYIKAASADFDKVYIDELDVREIFRRIASAAQKVKKGADLPLITDDYRVDGEMSKGLRRLQLTTQINDYEVKTTYHDNTIYGPYAEGTEGLEPYSAERRIVDLDIDAYDGRTRARITSSDLVYFETLGKDRGLPEYQQAISIEGKFNFSVWDGEAAGDGYTSQYQLAVMTDFGYSELNGPCAIANFSDMQLLLTDYSKERDMNFQAGVHFHENAYGQQNLDVCHDIPRDDFDVTESDPDHMADLYLAAKLDNYPDFSILLKDFYTYSDATNKAVINPYYENLYEGDEVRFESETDAAEAIINMSGAQLKFSAYENAQQQTLIKVVSAGHGDMKFVWNTETLKGYIDKNRSTGVERLLDVYKEDGEYFIRFEDGQVVAADMF